MDCSFCRLLKCSACSTSFEMVLKCSYCLITLLFFYLSFFKDWQGAHCREKKEPLGHTTVLCSWSSSWGIKDRGWIHPVDYLTFHSLTWTIEKKLLIRISFFFKWRLFFFEKKTVGPFYSELLKRNIPITSRKTFPRHFNFNWLSTLSDLLFSAKHILWCNFHKVLADMFLSFKL